MSNKKLTLQELEDGLLKEIDRCIPVVKELWSKGERTKSVCLEVNIDKAEAILKQPDRKRIEQMTSILKIY